MPASKAGKRAAAEATSSADQDADAQSKAMKFGANASGGVCEECERKRKSEAAKKKAKASGPTDGKIRKPKSLREQYLGRTPGKGSRTGKAVIKRMMKKGLIRKNRVTGKLEFKAKDKQWYDLSRADMAHKKPDAVTWWNKEGRKYGAKTPKVREFMLDPDHYYLELNSINRSEGAVLGQTQQYKPPLRR